MNDVMSAKMQGFAHLSQLELSAAKSLKVRAPNLCKQGVTGSIPVTSTILQIDNRSCPSEIGIDRLRGKTCGIHSRHQSFYRKIFCRLRTGMIPAISGRIHLSNAP
jgi:hypothetical protein